MSPSLILVMLLAAMVLWAIVVYNSLIRLRNRTQEGWSDIDVQLKRRHDLIPNLLESVKGYMQHERQLLENITRARAAAVEARASGDASTQAKTEQELGKYLGSLRLAVEAYPDIKANQNMAQLMDELADTENKIQAARRFYNGLVRDFNIRLETFPNNLIAGSLHFTNFNFFELDSASERENVAVKF